MRDLLQKIQEALRALQRRMVHPTAGEAARLAAAQSAQLQALAAMVAGTVDEEAGCDDVYELIDQYAEMVLRGEPAASLLPEVEHHLSLCPPCREEFEALLAILRLEQG
jgi:hypothetical protein